MRRLFAGLGAGAMLLLTQRPAFAHDCFNPNKPEGAGVTTRSRPHRHGPVFVQTGPGQGSAVFATIAPGVLGPGSPAVEVQHSEQHVERSGRRSGQHEAQHACDGKGIDYLDACAGG